MALGTIGALIAQNPRESLQIAGILAKLGQGYFAGRDQRSANQQNKDAIARANTISAFGGRAMPELVEPTAGRATTILGGLGTALGTASSLYGLHDAKKLRDLQMQNVQGQMDTRKLTDDITRGATLGAGSTLPQTSTIARKIAAAPGLTGPSGAGPRLAPASIELGGSVAPGGLSDVGQAAFSAAQNEQIAARAAAQGAAKQQAFENLIDLKKLGGLSTTGVGRTGSRAGGSTSVIEGLDLVRIDKETKIGAQIVQSAAAKGTSWDELLKTPLMMQFDPNTIPALQAAYENAQRSIVETQNADLADFLYTDLKSKFAADSYLKKSGDLKFGMNLLANGYKQQNGAGDLMMVNAMVRLSDPGVSVRPMEALQMEEVGGALAKAGVIASGEKWLDGDKFTEEVREKLILAGQDLYGGSVNLVNQALLKEAQAAVIPVLNLTGKQDINQVPALGKFINTYRLPPLESYGIKSTFTGPVQGIDYSKKRLFE